MRQLWRSRWPRSYAYSTPGVTPLSDQASFSHFVMKLFLAAPASGLPSLPTALPSQASILHFFTKLVFAAPESGLPSLLTALLSQDWANAEPTAKEVIRAARRMRFMSFLRLMASSGRRKFGPERQSVADPCPYATQRQFIYRCIGHKTDAIRFKVPSRVLAKPRGIIEPFASFTI